MKTISLLRSALLILILCMQIATAFAQNGANTCSTYFKDIPLKKVDASASLWANLRSIAGSLSFESNAIFQQAKELTATLIAPKNICPNKCTLAKQAVLFFRSTPKKLKVDDSDENYCRDLQRITVKRPIQYQADQIESIKALNKWIEQLSQGKGDNGADLYKKCDKSCSPRFEYLVSQIERDEGISAQASVVCGPARDKDDNQYDLESFFRWSCLPS